MAQRTKSHTVARPAVDSACVAKGEMGLRVALAKTVMGVVDVPACMQDLEEDPTRLGHVRNGLG